MTYLFKHLNKLTWLVIALCFLAISILCLIHAFQELQSTPSYRYPTLQERPADYQIRFNQARLKYGLGNTLHIFGNKFLNERGQVCTFKVRSKT